MNWSEFLPGAAGLQNVHPLVVHFPLALLSVAVVLYLAAAAARRESWARVALWLLVMGTVGAVAAAATGLYAEDGIMIAPSVRQHLLLPHRQLMLTTLGIATLVSLWAVLARPMPARGRALFLLMLVAMLAIMVRGADFGGRLVFGYNAGGDACGQPIDFSH